MRMSRILVSAAVAAALASPAAFANCVIVSGQGTLPNLGPSARVECSGVTTNMNVQSSVSGTVVLWLSGSQTTGGTVNYTANAPFGQFNFLSSAFVEDLSFIARGDNTLFTTNNGSTLRNFSALEITGNASNITINPNTSIIGSTSAPAMVVGGIDTVLNLAGGSVISHDASQNGIQGGAGRQTFNISGSILSAAGAGASINAGDGDDIINLLDSALIDKPIVGGAGNDLLTINSNDTFSFQSTGVETLRIGGQSLANVTLTNSHQFTAIDLQGRLSVANTFSLTNSSVAVTLNNIGSLRFTNSGTQIFTGSISGSGATLSGVTMDGTGTVVLSNANTFTGGSRINSGTVVLNDGQGLGTGGIINNGVLRIGGVTLANNVSGSGFIEKTANNLAFLTGNNSHTGGVIVRDGLLSASRRSLGQGQLVLESGTQFDYTDAGFVADFGNVAANANSSFRVLSGHNRFTGGTFGNLTLAGGRTSIIAPITVAGANGLRVNADAILEGNGTINGNVINSGIVAPGEIGIVNNNSFLPQADKSSPEDAVMQAPGDLIGTLTINGNYSQNPTGVLEIEFDANGGMDRLAVSGTATLDGTLRFRALNNAEGQGGVFLTAAGGVTGTFANVETIGAQLPLTVIYATNDAAQAPSLSTARPSTFNSQALAVADSGMAFVDVLANRLDLGDGKRAAWGQVFGAANERSEHDASLGYQHDAFGLAGGMDWKLGRHSRIGVGIAATQGEVDLDNGAGGGDVDSMLASLYLGTRAGKFDLSGGVVFGSAKQDTRRIVSFSSVEQQIDGETDSTLSGAFFAAGAFLGERNGWKVRFDGRASYLVQKQDAFTEDGSNALRLAVDEVEYEHGEFAAGFSFARPTRVKSGGEVTPFARIGGRYLAALDDREIGVAFAASNASVVLLGDDRDVFQGYGSLGILWAPKENVALQFGYSGQFSGDAKTHEVRAGVSVKL